MSKGTVYKLAGTLVLLIILLFKGYPQDSKLQTIRVMFYNVENLFDIYNDSLRDDDDFLPKGLMRWNYSRYNKKINSVYQSIVAAGEWNPPAIVAFCEVEKKSALEDLVYRTYLSKFNYGIIHEESPDLRGIDVCLIYMKGIVNITDFKYWIPSGIAKEDFSTRSVLYAKCAIFKDTIHLIVNHWPSRRGGVLAGEWLRMRISAMIREKSDSIATSCSGKARIVILGDFNCTPDDQVIQLFIRPAGKSDGNHQLSLVNLSEPFADKGLGTYRYQGTWEMLDQVIVSDYLLNCKTGPGTERQMFKIFQPEFLLRRDPKYPGFSPLSTYRGYKYQGGFSDHLPVLLDLKFR
jgi:hypothetical protein